MVGAPGAAVLRGEVVGGPQHLWTGARLPAGPAEEAHPSRLPVGTPLDCLEGTDGPAFTVSTLPLLLSIVAGRSCIHRINTTLRCCPHPHHSWACLGTVFISLFSKHNSALVSWLHWEGMKVWL